MTHRHAGCKAYLGDGVYAVLDGYGCVVLTTEDGVSVTNRIVLEPEVLDALDLWIEQTVGRKHAAQTP